MNAKSTMKAWAGLTVSVLLTTLSATAYAQSDDPAQKMLAKLRQQYPSTKFTSIASGPVDGLYEVVMGKNVAYIDKTGRYWLFGHLWDQSTQTDLTAAKMVNLDKVDVTQLPLDLAIRTVNGKPKRRMYVFSDPNCGYCKSLERDLPQLKDTEVYTFMTPFLGQSSATKIAAIWCSTDPAKTWNKWMTAQVEPTAPQSATCNAPIEKLGQLAKTLGVQGTPTVFAADGRRQVGVESIAALSVWLNGPQKDGAGSSVVLTEANKRQ